MASASLPPLLFLPSHRPSSRRWPAILEAWLPVLIFCGVFAVESTAAFGANRTSVPLHNFLQAIFGPAIDQNWSYTHHILRKIGHFSGYGGFSLVCFRGFWLTLRCRFGRIRQSLATQSACHALAIAATFFVAGADELHQTFLPNRTGCFSDVLLDTTGALALQLALFLILRVITQYPRHPAHEAQLTPAKTTQRHNLPLAA